MESWGSCYLALLFMQWWQVRDPGALELIGADVGLTLICTLLRSRRL